MIMVKGFDQIEQIYDDENIVVYKSRKQCERKYYALKVEKRETTLLRQEATILNRLFGLSGVPRILEQGYTNTERFYFVMELYEQSVQQIIKRESKLSLQSVLSIGITLLGILEGIHQQGIIHSNIRPETVMFAKDGLDHQNRLRLIGYYNAHLCNEIPQHSIKNTLPYLSRGYHRSVPLSQKDDLESLGYLLIKLRSGQLPWENNEEELMFKKKRALFNSKELLQDMPEEFRLYFGHIEISGKQPNYEQLEKLLKAILLKYCRTSELNIEEIHYLSPIPEVQNDVFCSLDPYMLSGKLKFQQNPSNTILTSQTDFESSVEGKIKGLENIAGKIKLLSSL